MTDAGPSTAPATGRETVAYNSALLTLSELSFSDPESRTLVNPLPVRSKKQISRVNALGKFRTQDADAPLGFKSTYRYFDWMSPTTGKLIPYITTVLDDGAYEVRAAVEPQNKKGFRGKTCSGAWVTLTREINKHMPEDAIKRRENLAFRDFLGLNSEVLRYLFDQMKAVDLGLEPPPIPPLPGQTPPHLEPFFNEENDLDGSEDEMHRMGAGGRMYRRKGNKGPRKHKEAGEVETVEGPDGVEVVKRKRRKKADKEAVGEEGGAEGDQQGSKVAKPKVLFSDPSLKPRKWSIRPLHIKTISGSSIVTAGWFSDEPRQVTRALQMALAAPLQPEEGA